MSELGDLLTMEAMDLPAHGRSGGRDRTVTWQMQTVAMAVAIIEKADFPLDLIGHSFGATVAIRIAVERPDLVRSLTLIEPVFFSAARDAGHVEYDKHLKEETEFARELEAGNFAAAAKAFSELWGGPVPWAKLPQKQRDYMIERMELVRDSTDAALGLGPDYIALQQLSDLKIPVLLIEGDQSNPIIAAVQSTLKDVLGNSKRVIVKGAGHMVPITHPKEVALEIRKFLSR